jgi:hypothetical protein
MAISAERIDFLTSSKVRILSSTLTEEEQEFRQRWLKMKQKEDRLRADIIKRKTYFDASYVPKDFAYCDWSSDEEFKEWLHSDRIIRRNILDSILKEPDWLETLAKKYYGDGWKVVYADTARGTNWAREELPDKHKLNKDVEED